MNLEDNLTFVDTFAKVHAVMGEYEGKNIRLSYSGGSDSDVIAWLLRYLGYDIPFVIFDTGLEFEATWRHVEYMRQQGFTIEVVKSKVTIPTAIKKYGVPFISKHVSNMMYRLNLHNFKYKEHGSLSFDDLYKMYPNSKSALQWWTNTNKGRSLNLDRNRFLKEFLIEHDGVPFHVSPKCCYHTKKAPSSRYGKDNDIDLFMLGIRRAEGGTRRAAYSSCFVPHEPVRGYALYMPIFWWEDKDKKLFSETLGIQLSDCYSVYGMRRTGCVGCPLAFRFEEELDAIDKYEPRLTKAVDNLFGISYEWTRMYREYRDKYKAEHKEQKKEQKRIEKENAKNNS